MNHLINFQNRRREYLVADSAVVDRLPSLQSGHNTELSMALQSAIFSLPDGYRQIVILHDQIGLQHTEIGELLAISPATSRSQLARARASLRDTLKDCMAEVI